MDNAANNSVMMNSNGYIEVIIRGDQTYLSFDQLRAEVEKFVSKLQFKGKELLGLVDLTGMTGFNTGSNKAAFELLESIPYKKVAIFGSNKAIASVTNLVIQAIGKGNQTKLFDERGSALTWLLAGEDV